jgi:hypothetical protein
MPSGWYWCNSGIRCVNLSGVMVQIEKYMLIVNLSGVMVHIEKGAYSVGHSSVKGCVASILKEWFSNNRKVCCC